MLYKNKHLHSCFLWTASIVLYGQNFLYRVSESSSVAELYPTFWSAYKDLTKHASLPLHYWIFATRLNNCSSSSVLAAHFMHKLSMRCEARVISHNNTPVAFKRIHYLEHITEQTKDNFRQKTSEEKPSSPEMDSELRALAWCVFVSMHVNMSIMRLVMTHSAFFIFVKISKHLHPSSREK